MTKRAQLHGLVRNLRQYLDWQAVPLAASVPATAEERDAWNAARSERQRARLERALAPEEPDASARSRAPEQPQQPESRPQQKRPEKTKPKPAKASNALWKDEAFGSGPRPTFGNTPEKPSKPKEPATTEPAQGAAAKLLAIREELGDCERCGLCKGRTNIVFGAGNPEARLMFIGEAPGEDEDREGEPFVGRSGALLDKMISAMTLTREEVYIANVLKCRPPNNRDPATDEIAKCGPFLKKQIAVIKPEVIVTTGKFASNLLTGNKGSLGAIRGKWQDFAGVPLMPTYHPSYLLRSPGQKKKAWADLKEVMVRLKLEIPDQYK